LLIGRVVVDVSVLRLLPNVVFTGTKPHSELPQWAKAIDVCILPFTKASVMLRSMSPLKLREYLAAGKPVVAVPMPEAMQFGNLVQTAEDGPGFVRVIEEALAGDSPELASLRQKAVEGNTWDATVANILEKLQTELFHRQER
jgi:glycosyltransferase involved in cell wall biosynthesis